MDRNAESDVLVRYWPTCVTLARPNDIVRYSKRTIRTCCGLIIYIPIGIPRMSEFCRIGASHVYRALRSLKSNNGSIAWAFIILAAKALYTRAGKNENELFLPSSEKVERKRVIVDLWRSFELMLRFGLLWEIRRRGKEAKRNELFFPSDRGRKTS